MGCNGISSGLRSKHRIALSTGSPDLIFDRDDRSHRERQIDAAKPPIVVAQPADWSRGAIVGSNQAGRIAWPGEQSESQYAGCTPADQVGVEAETRSIANIRLRRRFGRQRRSFPARS